MKEKETIEALLHIDNNKLSPKEEKALIEAINILKNNSDKYEWCIDCNEFDKEIHNCSHFSDVMKDIYVKLCNQNSYEALTEALMKLPLADNEKGNIYVKLIDVLETLHQFSFLINPKLLKEAYERGKTRATPTRLFDGTLIVNSDNIKKTKKIILGNECDSTTFIPAQKEDSKMISKLRNIVEKEERYKDFAFLEKPMPFNTVFKNTDISTVQVHSSHIIEQDDYVGLVGFCGVFSWKDNKLTPLDGDSYNEKMSVLGFSWFKDDDGNRCLDILVGNDW